MRLAASLSCALVGLLPKNTGMEQTTNAVPMARKRNDSFTTPYTNANPAVINHTFHASGERLGERYFSVWYPIPTTLPPIKIPIRAESTDKPAARATSRSSHVPLTPAQIGQILFPVMVLNRHTTAVISRIEANGNNKYHVIERRLGFQARSWQPRSTGA